MNKEEKNDITSALSKVQRHLNAPKNRRNTFGNYNYRNCEDIVEAVKKVMPDNCALTLSDDIWMAGDRFYVKAIATFLCGKESLSVTAFARESLEKKGMDAAMCTGASSSYARKYALNGLFAIDDSDDIDSHDNREEPKRASPPAARQYEVTPCAGTFDNGAVTSMKPSPSAPVFLTKDQVFKLSELVFKAKLNVQDIYKKYGVTSYEQLTNAQAREIASECNQLFASV